MDSEITQVEDVALPVESVELTKLKRKGGAPVIVLCEAVDEIRLQRALRALPGAAPQMGMTEGVTQDPSDVVESLVTRGAPLIEIGCVLKNADGTEVRPAFFFGDDPKNGALPGRLLSIGDRTKIIVTILRLSGFGGAAAESASFSGGDGGRSEDGSGTVAPREGDGDPAVGAAPREGEGVATPPDGSAGD